VFLTKSNSTVLDTRAVKSAQKAQAKAAKQAQDAAKQAQAASAAAAKKAQAAGSAAAKKAQAAGVTAATKAQAAGSAAAENAWQAASVAAENAASAAQAAAQNAAVAATSAAQGASTAAQKAAKSAADNINTGVRQGVFSARSWAAPKLENAAEYTTATVAPKVSEVLRSTAGKVSPADTKSRKLSALTWSLLGAAILAGVGAVAALVRYRYQAAITADSETAEEIIVVEEPLTGTPPVSSEVGQQPETGSDDPDATDASVNGRVSSTGR
jgi:hypothetical protein